MEWKEKRDLIDNELKTKFVPELRAKGFKGSYPHFRRFRDKVIDILGIQFSQWSPLFYIEIAVAPEEGITLLDGRHFPPKSIKHYQTIKRIRIGQGAFDYEQNSAEEIVERAIHSLAEAEEWWKSNQP